MPLTSYETTDGECLVREIRLVSRTKPELLAPAGNADCVRAAIENGADAVYFGLEAGFNARARAANFRVEDLPALMQQLHERNLKGYVTLNTLVFPSELPEVEKLVRQMATAGVDAVLVQDIGVARLAKSVCPDLPLHASTQMTMTSAETIALAEELGMERVVLARELSIEEIEAIRKKTNMPLEVFVHGALCVAYSGQCLTSESLGGRSANRGQCAQACRLSYELISDGQDIDLGDQKYLLSPQDLAAYELTPALIRAGVCSFKIEGRLKTPEYVGNITRHYRQAIDQAMDGLLVQLDAKDRYEMEMSFSRGFSPGWFHGCDHKMLVPATSSAKRGVLAGTVAKVAGTRVVVDLHCPLAAGDGIVFEGDRAKGEEQGGRIFGVFVEGVKVDGPAVEGSVALSFGQGMLDFDKIAPGIQVWKTDDPKLNQRLRKSYDVADPVRRVALDLEVHCRVGEPIRVTGRAESGASCEVVSDEVLAQAQTRPATDELLRTQLGRLGSTIFELRNLQATIDGEPMVPFSVLGTLRREIIKQLENSQPKISRQLSEDPVLPKLRERIESSAKKRFGIVSGKNDAADDAAEAQSEEHLQPCLHLLCREMEQVQAACEFGAKQLYVEFADIREYSEAVSVAHANGVAIWLATPRIQKPDEMGIFRSLSKHGADGVLVRNFAGLEFFLERELPVVADFSLNCSNELTAWYLVEKRSQRITASYDLNRDQLFDLVDAVPSEWLECVIHQHMPMFHMEHCVFCAVMSPGTNKTNCGRPCDDHKVELRDRIGMEHPLTADVGCRNTLYNATPQSSAEVVGELLKQGVRHYRVELLRENTEQTQQTMSLYSKLLLGKITASAVWQRLRASSRVGVTRGTLEERNPLAIL